MVACVATYLVAEQKDSAVGRSDIEVYQFQQRRLAATAGAGEEVKRSGRQVEINAAENGSVSTIVERDIFHPYHLQNLQKWRIKTK